MAVCTLCERDKHGRILVVKVAAEGHLHVLDVLPAVDIAEFDLGRVWNARVKRFVVIVSEDRRVSEVDLGFKLLTDEVGHQVGIPVGDDLAGAIAAGDGGGRADGSSAHGNLVVLFVFTGDVERNPLLVEEHGIVNQTFEDVEAPSTSFRRRQRLHLVFVFVGQAIEVVIGATDRFAGLAANPVVEI